MEYNTTKVKANDYWVYLKDTGYPKSFLIDKYTNIWNEEVLITCDIGGVIINPNPLKEKIPGKEGFLEDEGFYINNEDGCKVFLDASVKEYSRLKKKFKKLNSLKDKVNNEFIVADFYLMEGPEESITINDLYIIPDCFWVIPQNEEDENKLLKLIVNMVKEYVNLNYEKIYISEVALRKCIIQSICNMDISYLSDLPNFAYYSTDYKEELIVNFSQTYKNLILKGITSLKVKPTKCINCNSNTYKFNFYNSETDEFVMSYIIKKDTRDFQNYIVSTCNAKP